MPMPTTRYGRFKFYKERQLRREANRRRYHYRPSPHAHRLRSRDRDVSGETKQMPKVYPRYVWFPIRWEWEFWPWPVVKPDKGIFGVRPDPNAPALGIPPRGHNRTAVIGYQVRRVRSIPRLKHLPWMPWRAGLPTAFTRQVYPREFYPSGQESYASKQGWLVL